jgi:uncharacterized protein (UPF0216 family)
MTEEKKSKDYLNYKELKEIKKMIGNEDLLFSDNIVKIDKYNMTKERSIIITKSKIYYLNKKSMLYFK